MANILFQKTTYVSSQASLPLKMCWICNSLPRTVTMYDEYTHATICNTTEAPVNVFLHCTTVWLNNNSSVTKPLETGIPYSLKKGQEWLCANGSDANGSDAQSIHHAWQSNVWKVIDLKFTPTAKPRGGRRKGGRRARQKIERTEREREWDYSWGREREISSMCEPLTTSWHSSSVVLCLHACFTIGALWVCLNTSKQPEKQSERERDGGRKK